MKVKIKDLVPNPFRDMENYPINEEKIRSLSNSINQTGFWDNILARRNNGRIEIAYGHHRLVALQRLFKPDYVVDIPVKNLDDSTMIRVMANENDESWAITPGIIDETVRVTKEFLEKHPEIRKNFPYVKEIVGARFVSEFLGGNWNFERVKNSLVRLKMIQDDTLDKEAVEALPTAKAAKKFVSAVKKTDLKDKQAQKRVAERIVKEEDFSEEGIRSEVFEEKYHMEEKAEDKQKVRRREFEYHLQQISKKTDVLYRDLIDLLEYKDVLLSDYYQKSREGQDFVYSMARLFDAFRTLLAPKERRSDLIESFKLLIESKDKGI